MTTFRIEPLSEANRAEAAGILQRRWGTTRMVSRGRLFDAAAHPGFLARDESGSLGLITFEIAGPECEITTLQSLVEGRGVGSALIDVVRRIAADAGCARLWLITTNDNTPALRFYQKRGFRLVALYRDALAESRRLKPEIPLLGRDGIPLRDEIELEVRLRGQ
jgi:ribosomal protein S18 acetylase RimI-like enzyme